MINPTFKLLILNLYCNVHNHQYVEGFKNPDMDLQKKLYGHKYAVREDTQSDILCE